MAVYRRQRAKHKFEARSSAELSLQKGDIIRVWKNESGEWPDMENWVAGENERTRLRGEFPGNYTAFVEEVEPDLPPPLPVKPDHNGPSPPPVPARHSSDSPSHVHGVSPYPRQPPPVSPRFQSDSRSYPQPEPRSHSQPESRSRSHDLVEHDFSHPVKCTACKSS